MNSTEMMVSYILVSCHVVYTIYYFLQLTDIARFLDCSVGQRNSGYNMERPTLMLQTVAPVSAGMAMLLPSAGKGATAVSLLQLNR